ncbi:hypothetical protein CLOM_g10672 [Closterium sp. NIES-68]|nr:hypothetical protein CLOM_g10672 [Closterium sp. NIES-68]GJP71106.1 hypothetical protein CLOP_g1959 [Closterium sp. NIES-67]
MAASVRDEFLKPHTSPFLNPRYILAFLLGAAFAALFSAARLSPLGLSIADSILPLPAYPYPYDDNSSTGASPRHVCWWSGRHGGNIADSPDAPWLVERGEGEAERRVPGGVVVVGEECARCVAGRLCAFTIAVQRPAHWDVPRYSAFKGELLVALHGPATLQARVARIDNDARRILVTYRAWDAGDYVVVVRDSCGTLNYSAQHLSQRTHNIANWTLHVASNPHTALPSASRSPSAAAPAAGVGAGEASGDVVGQGVVAQNSGGERMGGEESMAEWWATPCSQGDSGRWLWQDDHYRWVPYPCAPPIPPPSQWASALLARGFREVSFVGDSHQRFLFLHLLFLLSGHVNASLVKSHREMSYLVGRAGQVRMLQGGPEEQVGEEERLSMPLKLNFYWVDGIYENDHYGCTNRGRFSGRDSSFPSISTTADVTIFNGGFWTAAFCQHAERALGVYLPAYLEWAFFQLEHTQNQRSKWRAQRKQEREANGGKAEGEGEEEADSGGPWLVYRSIPPLRTQYRCMQGTNAQVMHMNDVVQGQLERYGVAWLNMWPVELPRFTDTCSGDDPHFTCFTPGNNPHGDGVLSGPVGEAAAYRTVQYILNELS